MTAPGRATRPDGHADSEVRLKCQASFGCSSESGSGLPQSKTWRTELFMGLP
jgi:hypothetical protein